MDLLRLLWWTCVIVFASFQSGYIQPDEFFQNPEITAGDLLNVSHFRAWEWAPKHSLRTIVVPFLTTGIPFILLRLFISFFGMQPSAHSVLFISRISGLLSVFILETTFNKLASVYQPTAHSPEAMKFIFRTSYLVWVFGVRTFSNSFEMMLFGLLLYYALSVEFGRNRAKVVVVRWKRLCAIAAVSALGIFNRPTFLAFGFIPWCIFLNRLQIRQLAILVFFGLLFCGLCIAADSYYFGHFVITPLQFFLYNINPANNAAHGLHPRYFHLTVSLPQLFGPLLLIFFRRPGPSKQKILWLIFWVPCIIVSVIPHQEPRFLLALFIPITLLAADFIWKRKLLWVPWIIFNIVLGLFFGLVHQGGVTQSLGSVREIMDKHSNATFYYQTYLTPRFPLLLPKSKEKQIKDLGLKRLAPADVAAILKGTDDREKEGESFLVMPATVPVESVMPSGKKAELYRNHCPHWSFEAQPTYFPLSELPARLCLSVWRIVKKSAG